MNQYNPPTRPKHGYQQAAVTSTGEVIAIFADGDGYILSVVSDEDSPCFPFPIDDLSTVIDMLQRTLSGLAGSDSL